MGRILGMGGAARSVGAAVTGVAEVFVGNRAEREAAEHESFAAVVAQHGAEFGRPTTGRFDNFVDGLNRLPRPMLALGTLGLFVYAMAEPDGFGVRMQGLALVPEPLWWLLGAIVSFYFGAREMYHWRAGSGASSTVQTVVGRTTSTREEPATVYPDAGQATASPTPVAALAPVPVSRVAVRASDPHFNAALEEWRALRA